MVHAPADTPSERPRAGVLHGYRGLPGTHDELVDGDGAPWPGVQAVHDALGATDPADLARRQQLADRAFRTGGITFSVYAHGDGVEKIFPFDLVPRPVTGGQWARIERGLSQRVLALDLFLEDAYGPGRCFAQGVIPEDLVKGSTGWLPQVVGSRPRHGVHTHIAGIDLIRDPSGAWLVLEDNVRCPSGVSYVIENRAVLKRAFPKAFAQARVAPVESYPDRLQAALSAAAPEGVSDPHVVVLSPGPYNSAYFEHAFLARRTGFPLVLGTDLFVDDDTVYVKTTRGPRRVDVIYRRIDDDFLDPTVFRSDSVLGVPGLFGAWRAGRVGLCNAPGNGIADDKAVYPYVPDLIRYYLGEEPVLDQVPTFIGARPAELDHILTHLPELVVKAVDGAGGYGMLFGHGASAEEREAFAARIRANPRGYIAQPRIELSTCPVWDGTAMVPRRVDLRPYILRTPDPWVLPGGLTRVALREGSYVVNSSQGGGSKDTWILEDGP